MILPASARYFLSACVFFMLLIARAHGQTAAPTMDQLIGVNTHVYDPVNRINQFNIAREYHEWSSDIGLSAMSSPHCPTNKYQWNPSYNPGYNYDVFFQALPGKISPVLYGAAPEMYGLQAFDPLQLLRKPVCTTDDQTNSKTWLYHAKWVTLFGTRYGSGAYPSDYLQNFYNPNVQDATPTLPGQNLITYFENNNEQNKNWLDSPTDIANGTTKWLFFPDQFAAFSSADYDGNCTQPVIPGGKANPGDLIIPGTTKKYGLKNISPSSKFVMGGLAGLRGQYFLDMMTWVKTNRPNMPRVPFDVVNFHHYSNDYNHTKNSFNNIFNDYKNLIVLGQYGISPEEDSLKWRLCRLADTIVNKSGLPADISAELSKKEWWLSEFGYDTHPLSVQAAIPDTLIKLPVAQSVTLNGVAFNLNGYNLRAALSDDGYLSVRSVLRAVWNQLIPVNQNELFRMVNLAQAQWLVRNYLEIAATQRYSKSYQFSLGDDTGDASVNNNSVTGLDYLTHSSGLLRESARQFSPKKSWYYVQTLKNILTGFKFKADVNPSASLKWLDHSPKNYRFESDANFINKIFVVWSPTSDHPAATYKYSFYVKGLVLSATLVNMADGYENGIKSNLSPGLFLPYNMMKDSTLITITVGETPVFVVTNANLGNTIYPVSPAIQPFPNFAGTPLSCNAVKLSWNLYAGSPIVKYSVYYAKTSDLTSANGGGFDLGNPAILTYPDFDGTKNRTEAVIAGLQGQCGDYTYFVRGVNSNGDVVYASSTTVKPSTCACKIPVASDMVKYEPLSVDPVGNDVSKLFNYDNVDYCAITDNTPSLNDQFNWPPNYTAKSDTLKIGFRSKIKIDMIYIYETQNNNGNLSILYNDEVGKQRTLGVSTKEGYNHWHTLANFAPWPKPLIDTLYFVRNSKYDGYGKIIVCGEGGTNVRTIGSVQNVDPYTVSIVSPTQVKVSWTAVANNSSLPNVTGHISSYAISATYTPLAQNPFGYINDSLILKVNESQTQLSVVITDVSLVNAINSGKPYHITVENCACLPPLLNAGGVPLASFRGAGEAGSDPLADALDYKISLFPNPARSEASISSEPAIDKATVELFNALGEKITGISIDTLQEASKLTLKDTPNGLYFYRILREGKLLKTGKLQIMH